MISSGSSSGTSSGSPGPREAPEPPGLSVLVPFYDEADNVEPLHREIDAAVSRIAGGVELVYVDDGSRDATPHEKI